MGKYFSFEGKASRQEYWAVMIILWAAAFAVGLGFGINLMATASAESVSGIGASVLLFVVLLGVAIWVDFATTARRCRDAGISPWWTLVLIPANFMAFVGIIALVVFGVLPPKETTEAE